MLTAVPTAYMMTFMKRETFTNQPTRSSPVHQHARRYGGFGGLAG